METKIHLPFCCPQSQSFKKTVGSFLIKKRIKAMFTATFSLQIPHFTSRGHGVMLLYKYEYTEKDCDCAYP